MPPAGVSNDEYIHKVGQSNFNRVKEAKKKSYLWDTQSGKGGRIQQKIKISFNYFLLGPPTADTKLVKKVGHLGESLRYFQYHIY